MKHQNFRKVKLKKIFIGEIDGESEASREDFQSLFVNRENQYKKLLEGDKFIIKGRKGTGKTYLGQYIAIKANSKKNSFCEICDSSKFNLQRLVDLRGRDLMTGEYEVFWQWIILIHFANVILENDKYNCSIPFTKKRKLKNFIKKRYPNPESIFESSSYSDTVTNAIKGKKVKKDKYELSGEKSMSRSSTYEKREYYENLKYLKKLVKSILSKNMNIIIVYDDLDSIEANVHLDAFYINLLSGLLKSAKSLNLELQNNNSNLGIRSKVIVLIRDDIVCHMQDYDTNLNKVSSHFVDLDWLDKTKDDEPSQHPLMNLILHKIKKSVPEYSKLTNKKLYELLFPPKIRNKEAIYYLLDNSFGRPRDIIKFLNIVIESNSSSTSFSSKHFREGMKDYSNWFYDELRNEISIHHNAEFLRESLDLVKNIRKINFNIDDVKETYEKNKPNYTHIDDYNEAIKHMYKLGVIGNSWDSNNGVGEKKFKYSWGYRKGADSEPDFSKTFVVHGALRSKFSLL